MVIIKESWGMVTAVRVVNRVLSTCQYLCSIFLLVIVLLPVSAHGASSGARVFCVDKSATGLNNGISWHDAFTDLQNAIDVVHSLGGGDIWVRAGEYSTLGPTTVSDSYEAVNPDSVDIVGEERDIYYSTGEHSHLNLLYTKGSTTTIPTRASFGSTTTNDSFLTRIQVLKSSVDGLLVFANHPSDSGLLISSADLLNAANSGLLAAVEIKCQDDVVKWDYVLANLDDRADGCNKILWGIYADDAHRVVTGGPNFNSYMMGIIPTRTSFPEYSDRRIAFSDMISRGSFVILPPKFRIGVPKYSFSSSSDGTVSSLSVNLFVNKCAANSAVIKFYGCDSATGSKPGTLLYSKSITLDSNNSISYYLTKNGSLTGTALSPQEKSNIKYIRPVIEWSVNSAIQTAYMQPVRITTDGRWWSGPAVNMAAANEYVGPSPYPSELAGELAVYFNSHTHSTSSDGDSTPIATRKAYLDSFSAVDPSVPGFAVMTDHNYCTPFSPKTKCVIQMKEGVRLYGGFAGNENSFGQRNWQLNQTIIDAKKLGRCVYCNGADWADPSNAVLDGFTVTNGKALNTCAGGMWITNSSPTIENCLFVANTATNSAGAILNTQSSPKILNCTFRQNTVEVASAGALCNECDSRPIIKGCLFDRNTAKSGGAIFNSSQSTISNCNFVGNTASATGGGAIYNLRMSPVIQNCLFSNNVASYSSGYGGAIYSIYGIGPSIFNSTFVGNSSGGNTGNGGTIYSCNAPTELVSSIVAFNTSGLSISGCAIQSDHNCIYGNQNKDYVGVTPGVFDLRLDPGFINSSSGNYRLSSASPCVDAGDSSRVSLSWLDMDTACRLQGKSVDIGCYEFPDLVCPAFLPPAGAYAGSVLVDVVYPVKGAIIRYTTNGCDPAETDPVFSSKLNLTSNMTIRAAAWNPDGTTSLVSVAQYDIHSGIAALKSFTNGSNAALSSVVVTAVFVDQFYVEDDSRSSGICVNLANHGRSVGDRIDIQGVIQTNTNGERFIQAQTVSPIGSGYIRPVGINGLHIGGANWLYNSTTGSGQLGVPSGIGLNNIGLLVTIWGRVISRGYSTKFTWFKLDDGSGKQIKVQLPLSISPPLEGKFVSATGICSRQLSSGVYIPAILVRDANDFRYY